MTIVKSKVATGKLELSYDGGSTYTAFDCQPTSVAITPGDSGGNAADEIEVLCGEKDSEGASAASRTATLDITLISDFLAKGLVAFSWAHAGQKVQFKWTPNTVTDATHVWQGTVEVSAIEVGGEVNQRLTPSVSWNITALRMPPTYGGLWYLGGPPLTGITAPIGVGNLEWTMVPAGAAPPADLAALRAHPVIGNAGTAKPGADFTTGQFVTLGDGSKASWTTAGGWIVGARA
jgi:hypothetical protein